MKSTLIALLIAGSAMLSLTACHQSGYHDYYYSGWYDVYGYECGSLHAGCNYYANGSKISDYQDPYYDGDYYWDYYYDYYYGQWVWTSPSGIIYDDWGYALNRDAANISRDLIAQVSDEENKVVESAAAKFAAKYSLSSDVGLKVARTLNDWAKLGFTKGRTEADVADFTKRLYGVNISDVESAMTKAAVGDKSALNKLVGDAASNWKTSPETMKEILGAFHGRQLEDASIGL